MGAIRPSATETLLFHTLNSTEVSYVHQASALLLHVSAVVWAQTYQTAGEVTRQPPLAHTDSCFLPVGRNLWLQSVHKTKNFSLDSRVWRGRC